VKVTCHHPASSHGLPVILDEEDNVLAYAAGIKAVMSTLGLRPDDLARHCGVSVRTIHGWTQGRPVDAAPLNVMGLLLDRMFGRLK
jgi:hypothetical protein